MVNANPASLWQQFAFSLVIIICILLAITGSMQYMTEKKALHETLKSKYISSFKLAFASLQEPILKENFSELQNLVSKISGNDNDLIVIRITNDIGNPIYQWRNNQLTAPEPTLSFFNDYQVGDRTIASLEMSWSQHKALEELKYKTLVNLLIYGTTLCLLAGFLFWQVYRRIIKPIGKINNKLQNISENSSKDLVIDEFSSKDIALLNNNITNLSQSFHKLLLTEKVLNNAKKQIENLNRRNSNILNAAGEGIFVINIKGVIIFMNSAGCDMTRWQSNKINGMHFNCLMPKTQLNSKGIKDAANPVFSSIEENKIQKTLKWAKTHHMIHAQFINFDLETFPVEFICTPLKSEKEQTVGAVVTFNDISERLQLELKQKESQALKQAMLESSHDAIITIDEKGLICEFNKEAEHMLGHKTETVLGKRLDKLIIPQRDLNDSGCYFLTLAGQETQATPKAKTQFYALRKNQKVFPAELVLAPIKLNNRQYYTAFISDITERKQVKEAMEKARENAENANQAKSQFLATMSHEIRTPLSALIGVQDLMRTTQLNEEQNEFLNIANQSAQTLQDVINDVLDFSKIEAGKLILEFQETNPMDIVDSVLSVMASKALEKKIELLCSASNPIPETVLLDPVRTKQVLFNLVGNAIKFTHEGSIRVHLSITKKQEQDFILFEVIDTGIGISQNAIKTLFEEFTQADLSTTRKYGGTGLGLAISSRLVQMSNGEINVSSEIGQGSNFSFSIGPVKPPYVRAEPISDVKCWILDSKHYNMQVFYEQINQWIKASKLIKSLDQIKQSDAKNVIILNSELLNNHSPAQIKALKTNNDNCEIIALTEINERKLDNRWNHIIDKQISRPILFSKLLQIIAPYIGAQNNFVLAKQHQINEEKATPFLSQRHILLAEDSELIQKVIKNMLLKLNFHVDLAYNGIIALQKTKEKKYDLILMDLSMPEMGGLETTQKIRQSDNYNRDTPIIALTANAFKEDYKACKKAGMNGFLTKPITFNDLQQGLSSYLQDGHTQDSDTPAEEVTEEHNEPEADIELINFAVLKQLKEEISDGLFPQMIDLFIEQGTIRIKNIRQAIDEKDFQLLKSEVHTLKSESTTFGANKLGEISVEANLLCKQEQQQAAFELAEQACACWQDTISALKKSSATLI